MKSGAIHGKEKRLSLHLVVVAVEKGAFWSPSTTVVNFIYLLSIKFILNYFTIQIYNSKFTMNI